jgi:hypothetical protein
VTSPFSGSTVWEPTTPGTTGTFVPAESGLMPHGRRPSIVESLNQ